MYAQHSGLMKQIYFILPESKVELWENLELLPVLDQSLNIVFLLPCVIILSILFLLVHMLNVGFPLKLDKTN